MTKMIGYCLDVSGEGWREFTVGDRVKVSLPGESMWAEVKEQKEDGFVGELLNVSTSPLHNHVFGDLVFFTPEEAPAEGDDRSFWSPYVNKPSAALLLDTLPSYISHKVVRAVKIQELIISVGADIITLVPHGAICKPFEVGVDWYGRSMLTIMQNMGGSDSQCEEALVGGYFVQYEDGHQSWSPAEAFENGYTEIVEKGEGR